ncbi:MAG: oligoendopeptidase F [Bdellovibrionota bacterium]
MKKKPWFAVLCSTFLISSSALAFSPDANMKRSDVPGIYQWNPSHLFSSEKKWKKELSQLSKDMEKSSQSCKGNLGKSATFFFDCYSALLTNKDRIEKIYQYATLTFDVDQSNNHNQSLVNQATDVLSKFSSGYSFFTPEIIALGEKKILEEFLQEVPELKKYHYALSENFRLQGHVRSNEVEEVLAQATFFSDGAGRMREQILKDLSWKEFENAQGTQEKINDQNYARYRGSSDANLRKNVTQAFFDSYKAYENIYAQNLINEIKINWWQSQAHKYSSTREEKLKENDIPLEVYDNLINVVHKSLPKTLHRYVALKKKILKRPVYEIHDNYASTFPSYEKDIPFEDAKKILLESLQLLGPQPIEVLQMALRDQSGWIDIYPNQYKRSGAYNFGSYGVHPFVLMNYDNTYESVSTLGHELGHSLHSWFSMKNQPYVYSDVPVFTAEMASTGIEMLMVRYAIQDAKKRNATEELLYLYDQVLATLVGTFFRQTQFAEFEKLLHQKIQNGEGVTTKDVNDLYLSLVKKYYGPSYSIIPNQEVEWAFIPHFYESFYVYVYATSISAAVATAKGIEEGKIPASRFVDFLKSGSSKPAIALAKDLGVDMTVPDPFEQTANYFVETLNEFEALYKEWKKSAKH